MKNAMLILFFALLVIGCTAPSNTNGSNTGIIEMPSVDIPQDGTSVIDELVEQVQNITDSIEEAAENVTVSENTSNSSEKFIPDSRCKDSDVTDEFPNGINLGLKGAILINGVSIKNGADYCTNTVKVSEWYCQNGVPRVQVYSCPGKCTDGACE